MMLATFQEYNNKWPLLFEDEKIRIKKEFGDTAIDILHVGSTSIPGMPGKGIIDILILVENVEDVESYDKPLQKLGYINRPVPDRPESPFYTRPSVKPRTHNVHIALPRSFRANTLISFRDFLCINHNAAKEYAVAKRAIVTAKPDDWEFYSRKKFKTAADLSKRALQWYFNTEKAPITKLEDEAYFSFDIEADGPYPGRYSMLSIGMCLAGFSSGRKYHALEPRHNTFYTEIQPISDEFIPESVKANGLDREILKVTAPTPREAMHSLTEWMNRVAQNKNIVLVAYPSTFDWPFLNHYFHEFLDNEPPVQFTRICDLRTLLVVKSKSHYYTPTRECIPDRLMPERKLLHHGLEDAIEQAELFTACQLWNG